MARPLPFETKILSQTSKPRIFSIFFQKLYYLKLKVYSLIFFVDQIYAYYDLIIFVIIIMT
jgi:hypothetical protein